MQGWQRPVCAAGLTNLSVKIATHSRSRLMGVSQE
jgi:hypothetical protein